MTKKEGFKIARLINNCTMYQIAINIEKNKPERDAARLQSLMEDHDADGEELNALLGHTAILRFTPRKYECIANPRQW
jgi:hypothetical protein